VLSAVLSGVDLAAYTHSRDSLSTLNVLLQACCMV
jgi:hypothetical protein